MAESPTHPHARQVQAWVAAAAWLLPLLTLAGPASAPATAPAAIPQTPGFHHLYYSGQIAGQARSLAYSVYLPHNYDPSRSYPLVVYLVGLGDRGEDHAGLFNNGPPVYLSTNKELADWAPFIVLAPQCPKDLRWESPGVANLVGDLLDYAVQTWHADRERLYLTGLSNGGTGCWNVALARPRAFAAMAVFSGRDGELEKMPQALAGTSVWIICGGDDTPFATASRTMYDALKAANLDVLFVEIPGGKHSIWPAFYASREFYESLLSYRRNGPAPATRPTAEQFLAISQNAPHTADDVLARPLHKFLPWWFINNCGRSSVVGLRGNVFGRSNVFITAPLGKDVPCRLMTTTTIPAGKRTSLELTVAAPPSGQWQLIVRANGENLLKQTVGTGPATSPTTSSVRRVDPWVRLQVDLSRLAGEQIYLELLNAATDAPRGEAYWGQVQLRSE